MMMENSLVTKRPTISLSLLTTFSGSSSSASSSEKSFKSPRCFDFEAGVVGLGIVAATTDHDADTSLSSNVALSPRSTSIAIVSCAKPAANFRGSTITINMEREEPMVDEFSEGYTRVISHFPNNTIKKRVYFDDGLDDCMCTNEVFSTSPLNSGEPDCEYWTSDFLNSSNLCKKQLHGVDVFVYRGERTFCSAECRETHIRKEEYKEKHRSAPMEPLDCSISPCSSGPPVSFAGVFVV